MATPSGFGYVDRPTSKPGTKLYDISNVGSFERVGSEGPL